MSCNHILGAIILKPGSSQFPKIKILPYCILSGTSVSTAQLNSTRRVPYFSVGNGTVFPNGKLCVCRELDRSGFLPTPIPFGLLRMMGSLGTLNVQYLMVEIFAWNGAASSLMPIQILLHINRGVSFLANSTRFLLHRRDCLHVHISGRSNRMEACQ
ncbi:hypothetical protein BGY98DRAFT_658354 [Russula aff. rugulosa BPL654]|nr:hypothetical protein BGY98DRAFT_658354 [Russula aff. rugulosa BPL654]